jgi:hypothetical protein
MMARFPPIARIPAGALQAHFSTGENGKVGITRATGGQCEKLRSGRDSHAGRIARSGGGAPLVNDPTDKFTVSFPILPIALCI